MSGTTGALRVHKLLVGASNFGGYLGCWRNIASLTMPPHPYLAERDEKARGEWLAALDTIEALHPKAVVTGHGVLDPDSSPRHIHETRRYLHDFNATVANASTALDLYEKMLAQYPNRVNPGSLWAAAKAAKPGQAAA